MKKLLLISGLSFSILVHISAQPFQFKLNWKVGDKRTLKGESHEKEYENGVLTKDTIEYHELEISVIKETKNAFFINIRQENVALKSVVKFFNKVGQQELAKYKDLNLEYRIDKTTGKASLENWKKSRDFVLNSMKSIETYMKDKMPDESSTVKMLFLPIKMTFNSKESIDAYFNHTVNYLEYPYDQKVKLNDTITTTSKGANPMNPNDSLSETRKTVVKNMNKTTKQVDVWQTVIIDFEEVKKALKQMMEGMMTSFGVADSTKQKNGKDFDDIQMDMKLERIVTYNYQTSWPVKLTVNSSSIMQAAGRKSETFKTITATFR